MDITLKREENQAWQVHGAILWNNVLQNKPQLCGYPFKVYLSFQIGFQLMVVVNEQFDLMGNMFIHFKLIH